MQPQFLVTIDTEEEGLWSGAFRAVGNTVSNLRGIPRFQALCDAHGVLPTYLVDTPVAEDPYGAELLGALQRDGRAEVGAHLHPWCAPPFEEILCPRNSYLCNLPADLKRAKLERLTALIAERMGRPPTSFRAGRYGMDLDAAGVLADLGYAVDSSVLPFSDYSAEGGPCFAAAPWRPYVISGSDLLAHDSRGRLLEVPLTAGFSRANFASAARWLRRVNSPLGRRLRLVGLLDRLGVARRVKLSPEQAGAVAMRQLIDAFLKHAAPCVVLMFHSSSLVPGLSPYVRDTNDLERFFEALETVFEHACRTRRLLPNTLTGFAAAFRAARAGAGPQTAIQTR